MTRRSRPWPATFRARRWPRSPTGWIAPGRTCAAWSSGAAFPCAPRGGHRPGTARLKPPTGERGSGGAVSGTFAAGGGPCRDAPASFPTPRLPGLAMGGVGSTQVDGDGDRGLCRLVGLGQMAGAIQDVARRPELDLTGLVGEQREHGAGGSDAANRHDMADRLADVFLHLCVADRSAAVDTCIVAFASCASRCIGGCFRARQQVISERPLLGGEAVLIQRTVKLCLIGLAAMALGG